MRKLRIIDRGAISIALVCLSPRSSRQFFASFAVRKLLTAKSAKESQSSRRRSFGPRGGLGRQRTVGAAAWVVMIALLNLAAFGQTKQEVDLIVSGGIVVTMDGVRTIYRDGSVAVKGDAIVAAGPRGDIESRYMAAHMIDARGRLVLPGFVNGHTHVPMTLFRGLHDDVTLNDWL
jgi:hypothetical protein